MEGMIHPLIVTGKTALTLFGIAAGSAVAGAVASMVGEMIGDGTTVTIGVVTLVGGICWYLADTLRGLKDGQKQTNHRLLRIEALLGVKKLTEEETPK